MYQFSLILRVLVYGQHQNKNVLISNIKGLNKLVLPAWLESLFLFNATVSQNSTAVSKDTDQTAQADLGHGCLQYKPAHNKIYKMACTPSKNSDQLGISTVWSVSAWRKLGSWATHWAHSKDSDQTGQMPRLIWVFAGRTCHFVGFVMAQLVQAPILRCVSHIQTHALYGNKTFSVFCLKHRNTRIMNLKLLDICF